MALDSRSGTGRRRPRVGIREHWLLEGARLLSSSLDLPATLRQVVGLLVPRFVDRCWVDLTADGDLRPAVSAPEGVGRSERIERGVRRVWVTGRAAFHSRFAVMPLRARGTAIGILGVEVTGARRLGPADVAFRHLFELFGARAALALDNARLHTELRQSHEQNLRASRLESQLAQARLEALRAQLNPHFLFNALNTVAMLVRRRATEDALDGVVALSNMLRQVLEYRGAPEVRLGAELALVEHYLAVERLRYRERLEVTLRADPGTLDALVPTLLLQPLVENAVRHGVGRREDRGAVMVESRRESDVLHLSVSDDGPGFPAGWTLEHGAGVGLGNTRERLARLYPGAHRLEIGRGQTGGAVVALQVPFRTTRGAGP